jgi:hypothetical protein
MTEYDVIFSIFDPKFGPVVLYTSLDSIDIANKTAMKSFIAIGATESSADFESKYAVLPLPSYRKIAFYYMFRIKSDETGKLLFATIANMLDSESTIDFYKTLSSLQNEVKTAVEFIQNSFMYKGKDSVPDKNIIKVLNSLKTISLGEEGFVEKTTPADITYEDFKEGDLSFLFGYFPKDLDKVIYSLLLEEPVLVIGSAKDIILKVVASLSYLVPHRILVEEYLMNYVEPKGKDILICTSQVNYLKKYKKITQIHLESRKITSKSKDFPSLVNLIQTLSIAPINTQEPVIKQYIGKLLGKTTKLIELCEREQMTREEINDFRSNLNADELNIVISMVRNYAPQFDSKLFHFARSLI